MKFLIGLLFLPLSSAVWAQDILLTDFDPYGVRKENNSQVIARKIQSKFINKDIRVHLCSLPTVYDKAADVMEKCLLELPQQPMAVISLGEGICELKVETLTTNRDDATGKDNEGHKREKKVIIEGAPSIIGFNYPLHEMYCSLSRKEKRFITVSTDMENFVCNNTAFHFSHRFKFQQFGFIHVPHSQCKDNIENIEKSVSIISKMILALVDYNNHRQKGQFPLPHMDNDIRFSNQNRHLKNIRRQLKDVPNGRCYRQFLRKL